MIITEVSDLGTFEHPVSRKVLLSNRNKHIEDFGGNLGLSQKLPLTWISCGLDLDGNGLIVSSSQEVNARSTAMSWCNQPILLSSKATAKVPTIPRIIFFDNHYHGHALGTA